MAKDSEIDRIIADHFGGDTQNLCAELRVTKGAVSQWRSKIPPRRRAEIELLLIKRSQSQAPAETPAARGVSSAP